MKRSNKNQNKYSKKLMLIVFVGILLTSSIGLVFANIPDFVDNVLGNIFNFSEEQVDSNTISQSAIELTKNSEDEDIIEREIKLSEEAAELELPEDITSIFGKDKDSEDYYKKLVIEKGLTDLKIEKLKQYLLNYTDYFAILTIYDCLADNFFAYSDLDAAVKRYMNGESLDNILDYYIEFDRDFKSYNFEEDELEYYMISAGLSAQDIMMADLMSQHCGIPIKEIIDKMLELESWESLTEGYGIINSNRKLHSVDVNSEDILICQNELGLTEEEAIKEIVTADKAKIKKSDIVKMKKSKVKKGKIFVEEMHDRFLNKRSLRKGE